MISPIKCDCGTFLNTIHQGLKHRALPIMEKLHKKFDETVNLGVLVDTNINYIHFINTDKPLRHMVEPGSSDPFYSTALGRAIVAFLPENEQNSLIKKVKFNAITPKTTTSKMQFKKVLAKIQEDKWAVDDEESEIGVICFGVPLLENDYPIAAISITLPKSRLTSQLQKEITNALKDLS